MELENILIEKFKNYFKVKTGHCWSKYSEKFILTNIKMRLTKLNINSFREYFENFIVDKQIDNELDELFYLIINKESDFFRYPDQFEFLDKEVLPYLVLEKHQKNNKDIKIASIGFSKGQEIYSICMILEENKELLNDLKVFIDGLDILKKNVDAAKKGIYSKEHLRFFYNEDEPKFKNFLDKYFIPIDGRNKFIIKPNLMEYLNLKQFNLINDELNDIYDIIFCRNVIIYFDETEQIKSITKIYNHLKTGGYLFLGHSEFPIGMREKFKPIFYKKSVIYQKIID